MKYIVIVPDGMADEPIEEIGNKTPLEVARTTNMDYLARHGMTGLIKTIPDGMHPGSDIGNMSLLGYNPAITHTGRAPLEAANLDIDLKENEIAVRCNFVTVTDSKMIDYSAGHISTKEATLLVDALNEEIDLEGTKFYTGKSYRHLLVLTVRDPETYLKIKTVPPHDILGKAIKKYLPQGHESEMLLKLMEKSKNILEKHLVNTVRIDLQENPANMIWLWGQGTKPQLQPFQDKYGLKASMISAVDLVNGIGRLAGIDIIDVPGITGYYDTDYSAKAEYALNALKSNDFVFVHVESPDEAGHNGDLRAKIAAIENIDKKIVGPMLNAFDQHEVRILVLSDHPTPVELRTHTNDPVGFVLFGKNIEYDGSQNYSETVTKEQGLKFESGEALMQRFTKY